MTDESSFLDEPADTHEAIMKATYLALCEYGYAALTIQRIGDHFEKSKSLVYYHYDGKDELLLDFLDFMLERFEDRVPFPQGESPDAYLNAILDRVITPPDRDDGEEFAQAMVELRAQAAHDPEFRAHFTRSDEFLRKQLARIIRRGIDDGAFRDVDAKRSAAMLHALVVGTMTERVTTDAALTDAIRAEVDRYVTECILEGDASE